MIAVTCAAVRPGVSRFNVTANSNTATGVVGSITRAVGTRASNRRHATCGSNNQELTAHTNPRARRVGVLVPAPSRPATPTSLPTRRCPEPATFYLNPAPITSTPSPRRSRPSPLINACVTAHIVHRPRRARCRNTTSRQRRIRHCAHPPRTQTPRIIWTPQLASNRARSTASRSVPTMFNSAPGHQENPPVTGKTKIGRVLARSNDACPMNPTTATNTLPHPPSPPSMSLQQLRVLNQHGVQHASSKTLVASCTRGRCTHAVDGRHSGNIAETAHDRGIVHMLATAFAIAFANRNAPEEWTEHGPGAAIRERKGVRRRCGRGCSRTARIRFRLTGTARTWRKCRLSSPLLRLHRRT